MNIEIFRDYCLAKPGVTEGFPFDKTTLVFKVMEKMFTLANLDGDLFVNLKCDPEKAVRLREEYPAIKPGYYMNKKHWNTINIDGSVPDSLIFQLTDHSYELVVGSMTKIKKEQLKKLKNKKL